MKTDIQGRLFAIVILFFGIPLLSTLFYTPRGEVYKEMQTRYANLADEWTKIGVPNDDFAVIGFKIKSRDYLIFGNKVYLKVRYKFYLPTHDVKSYYIKETIKYNWQQIAIDDNSMVYSKDDKKHLRITEEKNGNWLMVFTYDNI
ncbi:MAG TPA: hypothetical protein IAB06_03530 [Candidatus Avacidaminococcus intestinavium]|uniref:Uncharacterized protein n=1 Tax=Candidatus Avacidaminococcus intestinavium TaxID=2840684 RepID=A0A9D1MPW8_9FIRM|nr:hypothetical protein [Candidatus Avacidaminococcus intestinavium]